MQETLPSHVVTSDLKEVFSRMCAVFSHEKGLISSVMSYHRYPDACDRGITSLSNRFPNELLLIRYLPKHRTVK